MHPVTPCHSISMRHWGIRYFGEVNPSAMDLELVENYQFTPATSDFDVALPTVCEDEPGTTNGGYGHWGGGGGDPPDWEIYPNIPPWDGPPLVH